MKETITLSSGAAYDLYTPEACVSAKGYMFYFHGGGFVYGSRKDIPSNLLALFLNKGYKVIALDYLLVPNVPIDKVIYSTLETVYSLIQTVIHKEPFLFCGRSAGSYLMMKLTEKLLEKKGPLPMRIINFYGYTDFSFIFKERRLSERTIQKQEIEAISVIGEVWDDPTFSRYLLYVYGVQQSLLGNFYQLTPKTSESFAIREEQLRSFPPVFSTASTTDTEVPFTYSKNLKLIPNSKFIPVYDLPHDFLKETENLQVAKVMQQLDKWLDQ